MRPIQLPVLEIDMRTFLSTLFFALSLFISVAGAAPATHAQGEEFNTPQLNASAAQQAAKLNAQTTAPAKVDSKAAQIQMDLPSALPDTGGIMNSIMTWIMTIFAWLLGAAMITLNYAVYYTVIQMGEYVRGLEAIGITWRILRDIANIMFIFGFLGAGIATILNVDQYGWKTKMLPMLLIGAVFLNFSLFITEAMIDGTNLFATQIYTQINGGEMPTAATLRDQGISGKIMQQLGLQQIYDPRTRPDVLKAENSLFVAFLAIILFIVTAFVMFSLAFILIARFVALIFFIILSPIGFMGLAIPQMQDRAGQWWKNFLDQIIVAPVLLLLLYVALKVITDGNFLAFGGAPDWLGLVPGTSTPANMAGFAGMLLSFLIAIGLLLVVVIKAKSMSAFGAGQAIKLGGLASFGAVSLAGRATLGMAGVGLANKRMQSWARDSNKSVLGRYTARTLAGVGKGFRGRTFDLRNVPGAAAGLGAIGVDAGKGATLTAKQVHDAQYGVKPIQEFFKRGTDEREAAGRELDLKDALKRAQDPSNPKADELAESTLSRMGNKEIEELDGIKKGVEVLVRNLSPEQFESLMKSDKFTEAEKENMRTGRYNSLKGAITAGDKSAVRQWSAKDLATALPDILKNPADAATLVGLMSEGQFDAVVKNDKLTKGQQQQLRDFSGPGTILNYLDIVNGRPLHAPALQAAGIIPAGMTPAAAAATVTPLLSTMGPKKFAKLRGEILTDGIAMSLLTPKHLAALMTDGDLDPGQIHTIANAVRAGAHPNNGAIMTYLDPATNPIAATYWV